MSERGSGPTVVGLDLSLASTGFARLGWDGAPGDGAMVPFTSRIESRPAKPATIVGRADRALRMRRRIVREVDGAKPDLVVVEGPAPSRGTLVGAHEVAGLWWLVVAELTYLWYRVAVVPPPNRAMYATGAGNAGKDRVLAAAIRRYPTVDITGNDVADAVVLAAMGQRHLGHPVEDHLPMTHLRAMDKIAWPDIEGGRGK